MRSDAEPLGPVAIALFRFCRTRPPVAKAWPSCCCWASTCDVKELTLESTVPMEPTLPLTYEVTSDSTCLSDDRVDPISELLEAISELAEERSLANDWNS